LAHVRSRVLDPAVKNHGTDESQVAAVKALLEVEIAAMPAQFNGCRVNVDASAQPGGRSVQVQIVPLTLMVDETPLAKAA
jgi:hypothetical protein